MKREEELSFFARVIDGCKAQCNRNKEPPFEIELFDSAVQNILVLVACVDEANLHRERNKNFNVGECEACELGVKLPENPRNKAQQQTYLCVYTNTVHGFLLQQLVDEQSSSNVLKYVATLEYEHSLLQVVGP